MTTRDGTSAVTHAFTDRRVIFNADDFGLSPGVNLGIAEAYDRGVLTSASLMALGDAAAHAVAIAAARPGLSLGLHLDFGEWVYAEGEWVPRREIVRLDDAWALRAEVSRQLDRFEALVGAPPTHLDSHQHVHALEPARGIVAEAGLRMGVPVRSVSGPVRYCGDFYGQTGVGEPRHEVLTLEGLVGILRGLDAPVTELGCHPGRDPGLDSVYARERMLEVHVLTDPRLPGVLAVERIVPASFASLAPASAAALH